MRFLRIPSLFGLAILFMLLLAACGGSTGSNGSTTTSSYSSNNSSSTPTTSLATPTSAPATPAAAPSSDSTVKTMTATVSGKSVTILTNAKGITLYYFTPDTKTSSACTGGCADNWPPLLATGSTPLTSAAPGKLTVQKNVNGMQIQYNGHFLYAFVGDQAPGDTKGEGLASGKWHVVTTDLAELS